MATFWDVSALKFISPVLIFILIFAVLYGILQKSKLFGGYQKLDFTIALVVSLVAMMSENVVKLIGTMTIWYVLLIVAIFLIVMVLNSGGIDGSFGLPILGRIAFYLSIIILLVSISHVFGPVFSPYSEGADPGWWALRTVFHPKVFGTLFLMLIAMVLIGKVTSES